MGGLSFGSALRQARACQEISLTELARLVHYNVGHLSRVERGERRPSPALARRCDQALGADGALAGLVIEEPRARGSAVRRPAQLPAAVAGFTGRAGPLAELGAAADGSANAVVISAVGGMAGIGKTALAVQFAHRVAARFPDGQLYVNLRGHDPSGQPVEPAAAVRGFLDALQVPAERIPADADAQAGLYRSRLAGRRVLILADNARDAAQVRPLLPGAPGCLVLVTSRHQLAGLAAADGARLIGLDLLTQAEARDLLSARIGQARVAAEPAAAGEIIAACGRLPLALTIAAARAAARPALPLADLAGELASHQLDALATRDDPATDVRAVFSWSYRALSPGAARLFRLLGLHPGLDITAPAAASLADLPPSRARALLAELSGAHLLSEPIPGRHALHDLLRAYGAELASQADTEAQRRAATGRLLDHYLHTGMACARLQDPLRDLITVDPARPGVTPEIPADAGQALAWFAAEHAVVLAAIRRAASDGFDACTWQLAWTIWNYLHCQGRWRDQLASQQLALAAAHRLGDVSAQAGAHRGIADACLRLGRLDQARTHYQHALALHEQAQDKFGQAQAQHGLALLSGQQQRHRDAIDHARHAIGLYRAAGHQRGQAAALNTAGWYLAQLGQHQQALQACQQALAAQQELGDRQSQAHTWDSLGYTHHHLGHHDQAAACYQNALHLIRPFAEPSSQAAFLTRLGDTHHAAGRHHAARTAWQQALAILNDLDHPDAAQLRAKLTTHQAQPETTKPATLPP